MDSPKKSPKQKVKSKKVSENMKARKQTLKTTGDGSKFEKPMMPKSGKLIKKKSNLTKNKHTIKEKPNMPAPQQDINLKKAGVKRKTDNNKAGEANVAKKPKLEEMTVKERRKVRKSEKTHFDIANKAKKLWDLLRRDDCPKAKQMELANEVYDLIKGKVDPLVYAHDTARVIECLMICGTPEIRNNLFEETKGSLLAFMKQKYSKFFVLKLLKYGTKDHRDCVMKAMLGKVTKLVHHTEASEVLELAYNDYANVTQRSQLIMEFYGPKYALFKDTPASSLKNLIETEPLQKDNILAFMKQTLTAVVEKAMIRHSIVHHVLLEYLKNCSVTDREEMIVAIREKVVDVLHTKEGSRVGLQCIWHGTSKDRKSIVKSMRDNAVKISMEDNGYIVLLAIFDCVDDTKLVKNVLLEEIAANCADLALHATGRKVLLYLIAPRNPVHFHPDIIKILSEGDGNSTSKKESSVRSKELLAAINNDILKCITDNTEKLITCPGACLFVQIALKNCIGDLSKIFANIADIASKPLANDVDEKSNNNHIVDNGPGHRFLKRLIIEDKERVKNNEKVIFSEILLNIVPEDTLRSWIECNRGAFILLSLVESEIVPVIKKVAVALKPVLDVLRKKKFKGAELLHLKLKSLN